MFGQIRAKAKWAAVRPWLTVVGLLSVGMVPCPDCGGPMVLHFWPVAIGMGLYKLARYRLGRPM
jgi:hypothetical protein